MNLSVGDLIELHNSKYYWLMEVTLLGVDYCMTSHIINTHILYAVGTIRVLMYPTFQLYNGRIIHRDPLPKT